MPPLIGRAWISDYARSWGKVLQDLPDGVKIGDRLTRHRLGNEANIGRFRC